MQKNKFYITTPIYYANAKPHIGSAYTTVAADVLARWNKLQGKEAFLLTGTDEHGAKVQKKAQEEGKEPQEFVDEIAGEFKKTWDSLNVEYDNFIRTTDPKHKEAVQKVLQTLYDKSAIYKGTYEGLYCIGCEQFKSDNELVEGKCPDHGTVPEKMEEECYLLKLTEIQNQLIEKIKKDEFKIAPEQFKKEILSFLEGQELKDVSISRKNVSWGVEIPFDKEHTTYVWLDAFLNYLTGIGFDGEKFTGEYAKPRDLAEQDFTWWPADINLIGKDILRVHATIWPAMLFHLGIELPKELFVHGFILSGGKKMSKSLGNVIGIEEMIEKFGVDGTRYLLLSAGTFGDDVDVTMERLVDKYNADLANGLGNLTSRIVKLSSSYKLQDTRYKQNPNFKSQISKFMQKIELGKALDYIWTIVRESNKFIEDNKPWELAKDESRKEEFEKVMEKLVSDLYVISELLTPFMPETSEKIKIALETKKTEILFQRIK